MLVRAAITKFLGPPRALTYIYRIASVPQYTEMEAMEKMGAGCSLCDYSEHGCLVCKMRPIYWGTEREVLAGVVHLSPLEEVDATAAKHFGVQQELVALAVLPANVPGRLSWHTARGRRGMYPHLKRGLRLTEVSHVIPVPPVESCALRSALCPPPLWETYLE